MCKIKDEIIKEREFADTEPIYEEDEIVYDCPHCQDTGAIEVIGDGSNFECDVIGYMPCICQED